MFKAARLSFAIIVVLSLIASISASADIYAWGFNNNYQLGFNDAVPRSKPELNVDLKQYNFTKIVAGDSFSLALTVDGRVYCWGNNDFGQCGEVSKTQHSVPFHVPVLTDVVDIAAGESSAFAITKSRDVYSWGSGQHGTLGQGDINNRHTPTIIKDLHNVTKISVHSSSFTVVALNSSGHLYGWGANSEGQLCLGNIASSVNSPALLTIPNNAAVLQVATGFTHTLILTTDNKLYSCGSNGHGELGRTSNVTNQTTPEIVNQTATSIAAGLHTSFAFDSQTDYWFAWGDDTDGQLGLGTLKANEPVPVQITDLNGKGGQITIGDTFAILLSDESPRTAYFWGTDYGNINGTPIEISDFNNSSMVQVSSGVQFAFAIACACLRGGSCTSDDPYKCQCPDHTNGSLCENCILDCGEHGTLNSTLCSCSCAEGFSGPDCTIGDSNSDGGLDFETLLLTLGATIAISLPLAILFIVIVIITIAVLVMYMRKTSDNPKHRLFDNPTSSLEMKSTNTLTQPLYASSVEITSTSVQSTATVNDGTKVIGGWRFAADFDDEDDWVRTVDSHSVELSSPDLASPYVKVPPAPFSCISDIGFEENLNPRHRQTMEDGHCMIDGFAGVPTSGYFAIYDGHGGTGCVEFVQSRFHTIIQEELGQTPNDVKDAFKRAYLRMDKMLEEKMGGSTCITAFIRHEVDATTGAQIRKLYSGNCGDARTVLCRGDQAIRITRDHKASDEQDDIDEADRIRAAGGFIARGRVNGVLAVTRSLGDHNMKQWIIPDPYQTEWTLTSADTFLVLACDGLWDVMKDQEVVDFVKSMRMESATAQTIAAAIVKKALDKKTKDNVSVMVVFL